MKRKNFPERKAAKRERAAALTAERAMRTPEQQLQKLTQGRFQAKKERARLVKQIEAERGTS